MRKFETDGGGRSDRHEFAAMNRRGEEGRGPMPEVFQRLYPEPPDAARDFIEEEKPI